LITVKAGSTLDQEQGLQKGIVIQGVATPCLIIMVMSSKMIVDF
jgi:hypothetical protein